MRHCLSLLPPAARSRCPPRRAAVGRGRAGTWPGPAGRSPAAAAVPVTRAPPAGAAAGPHAGAPAPTRDGAAAATGTPRGSGGGGGFFPRPCQTRLLVSFPATARVGAGGTGPWGGVCGDVSSAEHKEWGKTYIWRGGIPHSPRGTFPSRLNFPGSPEQVSEAHTPPAAPRPKWVHAPGEGWGHVRPGRAPGGPAAAAPACPPAWSPRKVWPERGRGETGSGSGGALAVARGLPCAPLRGGGKAGLAQTHAPGRCAPASFSRLLGALRVSGNLLRNFMCPNNGCKTLPRLQVSGWTGRGGVKGCAPRPALGLRAEPRCRAEPPPFLIK